MPLQTVLASVIMGLVAADLTVDPPFFRGVPHTRVTASGAAMSAKPPVLGRSGNWVSVNWKGVNSPQSRDWIGLFDAAANYSRDAPLKFKMVAAGHTVDNDPLVSGEGYAEFRLIDVRARLRFAYLRGFDEPMVLAESGPIAFASAPPQQCHLALTEQQQEVRVSFVSPHGCSPALDWAECGQPRAAATVATYTYGPEALCGPPATTVGWRDPGLLATAVLRELRPGACYEYRAHCASSNVSAAPMRFRAPPARGETRPFSFAVLADLGQSETDGSYVLEGKSQAAHETVARLASVAGCEAVCATATSGCGLDFVLHPGDISYARGARRAD